MELLEGIETRRSLRAFKSTPITKEVLERILKAAGKSPSYTNTQPWEVAVISGKKKEELSRILCELVESNITPNPDLPSPGNWPPELERRAREHGMRRFQAIGIERENEQQRKELRLSNFKFYGAPWFYSSSWTVCLVPGQSLIWDYSRKLSSWLLIPLG
ncbi:Nitroreductase NfnB [subsurface metagenome]